MLLRNEVLFENVVVCGLSHKIEVSRVLRKLFLLHYYNVSGLFTSFPLSRKIFLRTTSYLMVWLILSIDLGDTGLLPEFYLGHTMVNHNAPLLLLDVAGNGSRITPVVGRGLEYRLLSFNSPLHSRWTDG